jgi:hypothetical protein
MPLSHEEWQAVADDLVAADRLLCSVIDRLYEALPKKDMRCLYTALRRFNVARSELNDIGDRQLGQDTNKMFYGRDCVSP